MTLPLPPPLLLLAPVESTRSSSRLAPATYAFVRGAQLGDRVTVRVPVDAALPERETEGVLLVDRDDDIDARGDADAFAPRERVPVALWLCVGVRDALGVLDGDALSCGAKATLRYARAPGGAVESTTTRPSCDV